MPTDFTHDRAVVPFEPRRSARSVAARQHGGAELLHFPTRAEADALRRRRQAAGGTEPRSGHEVRTGLFEAVTQANVRAMQTMFRLTGPAGWLGLQQRAAQDYMAAVVTANFALMEAMTSMIAGPAVGRSTLRAPASLRTRT